MNQIVSTLYTTLWLLSNSMYYVRKKTAHNLVSSSLSFPSGNFLIAIWWQPILNDSTSVDNNYVHLI